MKSFVPTSLFLIACVVIMSACKSTEEAIEESPAPQASEEIVDAPAEIINQAEIVDSTEERSLFASIERGACYGFCPTYTMKIYSNGFVEYTGFRAVDMVGSFTRTITQEEMDAILDKAIEIDFINMKESYDGPVSDLPGTKTTVVIDDKLKEVYRRYDFPKSILSLEVLFDSLLKSLDWVEVASE